MSDDPWDALAESWRAVAPRDPPPAPDHIRRQVLRADRRFLLFAAADVGVCLFGVAWIAWFLATHKGPAAFMFGFIMLAFIGYCLDFAFAIRRGVWRAADDSTDAWLRLLAERCLRRRRYVRVGWLILFAMTLAFALGALVLLLWFPEEAARLERRGWWLIAWFAVVYLVQWLCAKRFLADAAEQEQRIAAWREELGTPLG
jgi:MFS family permease